MRKFWTLIAFVDTTDKLFAIWTKEIASSAQCSDEFRSQK